jgi:hypothetical protein
MIKAGILYSQQIHPGEPILSRSALKQAPGSYSFMAENLITNCDESQ